MADAEVEEQTGLTAVLVVLHEVAPQVVVAVELDGDGGAHAVVPGPEVLRVCGHFLLTFHIHPVVRRWSPPRQPPFLYLR